MNVSAERIASLHLAHLQKEAKVSEGIENLAKKAVLEDFRQKVVAIGKKKATKKSNKGWSWVLKSEGADLTQVIQDANRSKSSFDSKDPLTRLLHRTLSKVSDPFEKNRIVGEFSESYAKKDIEGMADVLGVDGDVVTITLLWYMRDVKVANKEARSRGKNRGKNRDKNRGKNRDKNRGKNRDKNRGDARSPERSPKPSSRRTPSPEVQGKPKLKSPVRPEKNRQSPNPKLLEERAYLDKQEYQDARAEILDDFEKYSGFSSKALRTASLITGGPAIEWLVNLLPKGEVLAKPAKWAWWAYLVANHWTVISAVAKWSSVAYNWLISISANSFPMVSGFLDFFTGGTWAFYFAIVLVVLGSLVFVSNKIVGEARALGELLGRASKWQKAKLSFFWVWNAIKSAVTGALNVGRYVRNEILDYVKENASMFNYLIKKHDVEDSAPPEINEVLVEAT